MLFLLLGGKADRRPSGVLAEIETSVKSYIVSTIFLSAATGMLLGATLAVLGVEFAWVFGLLAFLLNFVPSIGAIIASLLPLPVILLSANLSVTAKVLAIVVPAAVQFVIGSFVQPRVQGHALDLHPVVILSGADLLRHDLGHHGGVSGDPDHGGGADRFGEDPHYAAAGRYAGGQFGRAFGRAVERISIRSRRPRGTVPFLWRPATKIGTVPGFQSRWRADFNPLVRIEFWHARTE